MVRRGRWDSLPPHARDGAVNVVVETPRGSRNKYKFEPDLGVFSLSKVRPAGMSFPFDFGYLPGTLGGDGDPLDVLLIIDDPVFAGCLVPSRLIGVIEATQTKGKGRPCRNDRLIAVATGSQEHQDIRSLADLRPGLVEQIEHFFVSYHEQSGNTFRPRARHGPARAKALLRKGIRAATANGKDQAAHQPAERARSRP